MKQALAKTDTPNESWNQILMASYYELDQYDEAAALVQQQLAKNPDDFRLMKQLATIYVNGDKYPQAIEVLSKAKSKGLITSNDDYLQLAKLYANADKPRKLPRRSRKGPTRARKPSLESYRLLGDVCSQKDDDACTIDAYSKASPFATDGNVDYQLGYYLYYADRVSEAKEALTRAISRGGLRQRASLCHARRRPERTQRQRRRHGRLASPPSRAKVMAEQRIKAATTGVAEAHHAMKHSDDRDSAIRHPDTLSARRCCTAGPRGSSNANRSSEVSGSLASTTLVWSKLMVDTFNPNAIRSTGRVWSLAGVHRPRIVGRRHAGLRRRRKRRWSTTR